jgi:hypothetical protein
LLALAAPEAFENNRFSAASDTFAYAITLIEIFNDGETP